MNSKALFLDLDGTLLNDKKEITAGNREAISKALAAGHRIIINTGRPLISAIQQAKALQLDGPGCYLIAYNGGILYDLGQEKIISQVSIPVELVKQVFEEANRRQLHIQTYNDTQVLVESRCNNESVQRYCSLIHMTYKVIPDIHQLKEEPVKVLAIDYHNHAPLKEFQDWIHSNLDHCLDTFFSCNEYLEIVPKGLNKGNALQQMAVLLEIPMENTIAAGDAANDLPMIEAAHIGVCMCNGEAGLKAIADHITTRDNNHDGVAEIIETFILQEPGSH